MKSLLTGLLAAVLGFGLALGTPDVEAKRLGGGGMSRQLPPRQAPSTPPKQATPDNNATSPSAAPGAAGAAQTAGRRSWMGPIAGLAAGLGLAALMSHLGLGAEFANFLMLALLVIAGIFVVRLLMRRFAAPQGQGAGPRMQYAGAGAGAGAQPGAPFGHETARPMQFSAGAGASAAQPAGGPQLPPGFDVPGFERVAKMIFIRLQAANDAGDLDDLRRFTTPEMFAAARLDLQDRRGAAQQTDVVQLDAQVVDFAREDGREIVSVRYHGLIREEQGGVAEPFDEVWHLVKPIDGSREWAIAGIQPYA